MDRQTLNKVYAVADLATATNLLRSVRVRIMLNSEQEKRLTKTANELMALRNELRVEAGLPV